MTHRPIWLEAVGSLEVHHYAKRAVATLCDEHGAVLAVLPARTFNGIEHQFELLKHALQSYRPLQPDGTRARLGLVDGITGRTTLMHDNELLSYDTRLTNGLPVRLGSLDDDNVLRLGHQELEPLPRCEETVRQFASQYAGRRLCRQ